MGAKWRDRLQRSGLLATVLLYSAGYGTWGLVLLLITTLLGAAATRRLPWTRSRLDGFLAAFLAAFLIAGVRSPYRPVALGTLGLAALTLYVAFGSTAAAVRRHPSFLRTLTMAWVAGAVGAALWGMILHYRDGVPAFTPVLGQNALGTTLLIAAILSLGFVLELHGRSQYLAAASGFLLFAGLILTYTRAAWLGAIVGGALLLGLSGVRKLLTGSVAIAMAVLAGLVLFGSESTALISRAASIVDLSANKYRLVIYQVSFDLFAAHPVSGTGLGTFPLVYPAFRPPNDPNPLPVPFAHNVFLNMAAEGGIIGFITFLAVVLAGISGGWQWQRRSRGSAEHTTAAAFLAAFVGAMVSQLFDGTLLSVHLGLGMWVLLAVLGAGWTRTDPRAPRGWTSA